MQAKKLIFMALLAGSGTMAGAQEVKDTIREVVVTGTGTEHLLRDTPVQTEVISRKMLDSYGGKSIEDILGGLTAAFAFGEGDMGSQMQLGGLGNNYILILVDGKRLHGDNGGENDLGLINPHNIERIEIVRGAQSALYGSDAMAGVINIITRKHDTGGILLENTTRYGSYNDLRQHNGIGFRMGKLQSYTGFQLQHNDGWQNTAMQQAEGKILTDTRTKTANAFTNWQVSERLTYNLSKETELYADGSYYTKRISRPTDGRYPSCDVYTYDLMYRNASASLGGKTVLRSLRSGERIGTLTFDVDWDKHAYYYYYTARTYEYMKLQGKEYGDLDGEWYSVPYYPGQKLLQSDQQRLMANTKSILYLPKGNTLTTGAEYRYDHLEAPLRTETGTAHDQTGALYAQDEWSMLRWVNITGGARLVYNANYGLHFTPKLSAMLSFGDFRVRLGWSQGFKSPTVKELYYRYLHVMGSSTFFNLGNTQLKPQTNNYLNADLEYRTDRLTIAVGGYYNRLRNMIALVNVPVEEIPQGITTAYLGDGSGKVTTRMYRNMEDARTWGIDLNMSYKLLKELTLTANYSYLDTEANQYDTDHDRMHQAIIDGMAHSKWNASATYGHRFSKLYRLGINLSGRGSSTRYYENNGNGAPFQIWRLNTTHDFGRTDAPLSYKVDLGIDNIFNYRDKAMHPLHLGTNSPGTTVYASFAVRFNKGKKVNSIKLINKSPDNENE